MSNIDSIIRTLSTLTPEMKRELVQRLAAENLAEVSAAAAETAKKTRLAKIAAARAEGNNPTFNFCQGVLRRLGVVIEDVAAFDRLFASSALSSRVNADERLATKHGLYKLGLLG